jgi:hypothetical protein
MGLSTALPNREEGEPIPHLMVVLLDRCFVDKVLSTSFCRQVFADNY